MPTTDEALAKKRQDVETLREHLAAAEAETARLMREKENDSTAEALDAEVTRLQVQLEAKYQEVDALGGDPSAIVVPPKKVAKDTTLATPSPSTATSITTSKTNGEG